MVGVFQERILIGVLVILAVVTFSIFSTDREYDKQNTLLTFIEKEL